MSEKKIIVERSLNLNRRSFLGKTAMGVGGVALASLLGSNLFRKDKNGILTRDDSLNGVKGILNSLHHPAKIKRVIYLFQSGGPSQLELFDYKPLLNQRRGEDLPESIRNGQRLTGMTAGQDKFPLVGSQHNFSQHGKNGTYISDILPYTAKMVDELCIIKSMYTEAINHDPAVTFFQTGSQQPGRPSIGSWLSYGLGSENENLPAFTVLLSRGTGRPNAQPLYTRLWGNGFLHSLHQGVQFRAAKDPVLYLNDPKGITKEVKRKMLDHLAELNEKHFEDTGDPEIKSRIAQYEMAYKMQTSVPKVMDTSKEPDYIYEMYGAEAQIPGTYAANCLLARRLAEQDVRFIQLYHVGWDQHENLPTSIAKQAKDVDQASAALVTDLKQRGLLEDTLVIWGGEFGRTNYSQGPLTEINYGRDHHPRSFTIWMAGGGIKPGMVYGETDDFGYNIVKDPVHVHDFQATMLHLLGIDHEKLTYKYQGRRFRLTDVEGHIIKDILT
ncbi:MAG TPA: sulfatase [Arenibacter sp.]|nr:sulfatase [Arenibacter sp.]|tara:strand:- start:2797 stop:4290 length:1494 start_codon:yes stop_codon:yes gene_type:complete